MFGVVIKTVRRPGPDLDFSAAPAIIGAVSGASEADPSCEARGVLAVPPTAGPRQDNRANEAYRLPSRQRQRGCRMVPR